MRDSHSPHTRRATALGALAVVTLLAFVLWRPWEAPPRHDFVGASMGTSYRVTVEAPLSDEERSRVGSVIEERLGRVETLMSTYDPDSELSRFNRTRSTAPMEVSDEFLEVLEVALAVARRSGGAFDPTVAPLVEAWGFGPAAGFGATASRPTDEELVRLRARVGYGLVAVDRAAGTVAKSHPAVALDLSGIAKGYGVGMVAEALRSLRLGQFLVDVGGELEAAGEPAGRSGWTIGIERPDPGVAGIWGTVELRDESVATSGDYRDYYEEEGVRYAHIIDPRDGRPISWQGTSVTVLHRSAALADAWATALSVLGPEEGFETAAREGLAALFLRRSGSGVEALATPAMAGRATRREGQP